MSFFDRALWGNDQTGCPFGCTTEHVKQSERAWSPKRLEMQDYMATYQVKVRAASKARGLPVEVGMPEHHKIAKEVVANKKVRDRQNCEG